MDTSVEGDKAMSDSTVDPLDGCWTACEKHAAVKVDPILGVFAKYDPRCDGCLRATALAYGRKVARKCAEIADREDRKRSQHSIANTEGESWAGGLIRSCFGIEEGE